MGAHLINGLFQSDKYPTCPPDKVPLSVRDQSAQPLLWAYAQIRQSIDAEFADDLETRLRAVGFIPPAVAAPDSLASIKATWLLPCSSECWGTESAMQYSDDHGTYCPAFYRPVVAAVLAELINALTGIAELPSPEQDNTVSTNMRSAALTALGWLQKRDDD